MIGDPLAQSHGTTKMARRGIGDLGKGKMVLAALARLTGQACDDKKHIRHMMSLPADTFKKHIRLILL